MGNLKRLREACLIAFKENNIDGSDLDWIMVDVLNISRSELGLDLNIDKKQVKKIYKLVKLRIKGKPLTQIMGYTEF